MKILFYGFRHGHMDGLYRMVQSRPGTEIVACAEENAEAAAAAEARLGLRTDPRSYAELLQTDCNVVAIGGAYTDRGQAAIAALRAGKHLISDKPLCTSTDELREIRALSRSLNRKIAVMLDLRYLPQALRAREVLRSGMLGEVRSISFDGQHCIDYDHRPSWYFEGKHGGTVNDLAIHGIDLVRWLTGLEWGQADGIRTWNAFAVRHPDFYDSAMILARLSNGAEVSADVSYSAPQSAFTLPTYWSFRFWCERGMMTFHYTDPRVTVYTDAGAQVLDGISAEYTVLDDLDREIGSPTERTFTESVLDSTETALRLQQCADRSAH